MTDDMLKALAAKNGVAQVNFYCAFVSEKYRETAHQLAEQHDPDYEKVQELFIKPMTPEVKQQLERGQSATGAQVAASAAQRSHRPYRSHGESCRRGPCRPGLGFRRHRLLAARHRLGSRPAEDYRGALRARLQGRDLDKILGGNLLRVFGDVEKVSKQMQAEAQVVDSGSWLVDSERHTNSLTLSTIH